MTRIRVALVALCITAPFPDVLHALAQSAEGAVDCAEDGVTQSLPGSRHTTPINQCPKRSLVCFRVAPSVGPQARQISERIRA